jgi:hypothetical protein
MSDATDDFWFKFWEKPDIQLHLMAEGPSKKFLDMSFNNAIYLAGDKESPSFPHDAMVQLFRYEWSLHSERRLFFLSLIIDRNPAKFAAFYLDFLRNLNSFFVEDGPYTDQWNLLCSELESVASGTINADSAISYRDWTAQSSGLHEKILSLTYDMARSLLAERSYDFLRDIFIAFDDIWMNASNGRGGTRLLMGKVMHIAMDLVAKHFPEPPNLKTMRFE